MEEKTGIKFESENSETLGAFLMEMLGEIPDEDEHKERIIEFENYTFKIHVAPEPTFESKFNNIVKAVKQD